MAHHRCYALLPKVETSACTSDSHYRLWLLLIITQNKHVSRAQILKCTKVVLLTHFTCEAPLILAFHPICCLFGMKTYEIPFSSIGLMAAQIAFFFVFEDTFHYWAHRALHFGPLYKHIHKLHHEFSAPIGIVSSFASFFISRALRLISYRPRNMPILLKF